MKNKFVAFYTASLFSVHPILTESVTWISGANYTRYTFFFLLSFLSFLLAQKDKKWYVVSFISFTLSFFSSEKALAIPLVFLLYIFVFRNEKKEYYPIVGYFAIFSGFLLYYLTRVGERLGHLGAVQYAQESTIYNYNQLLQIPIAVTMYLQLIFFPKNLTVYHTEIVSYPELFVRSIIFLTFFLLTLFWYRRNKLLFFWSTFFVITLIPTLTPWGLSSSVAERYTYLGSIGVFFLVGYGIYYLQKKYGHQIAFSIISILLILLGIRTIIRNNDYKTFESFWESTAKVSPLSYQAQNNVGIIKAQKGDLDGALQQFRKAIEIVPNSAQAYQNIGSVYFTAKKYPEALKFYEKTVELNPAAWVAYQNMAAIYFEQGKLEKAVDYTKKALTINSRNINLLNNLAFIYIKKKDLKKATEYLQDAMIIDPKNPQTLQLLQHVK
jgi:tetratricopeptide (TPR) repeat protein